MRARGFTLIELLVGLAIFAILLMLAMPMYTQFMANTQVRNVAESMLNGVRIAQTEAVKRNEAVKFILDPSKGWEVRDVATNGDVAKGGVFKSENVVETSPKATITRVPAAATEVTFSGLGRVLPTNPSGTARITQIDVTTTMTTGTRDLRVVIPATGGGVKLCDPKFTGADPLACP
jgi:type IV fimbrial biogenesis protein FimT